MDPVTLIVAAVAIGASEGARESTKQAIGDAYAALKSWLTSRYGAVSGDVEALVQEPEEELRRQILAKKLGQAGADSDPELLALANTLLAAVDDEAPELPATVGVMIRRASVGGDIEVSEVAVDGGSGVVAEDVAAGRDLTIRGVAARSPQEPPSPTGGVVNGQPTTSHAFTATQENVRIGRDNNTYYSVGTTETGNSGGRIRAVTASVKPVPIGQGLWTVAVNNASSGPITCLEVDVYAVDEQGDRLEDACHPAKNKISLETLFREGLTGALGGTLDAIGTQARSMYGPLAMGGVPSNLGAYSGMLGSQLSSVPGVSHLLQSAQQQMVDRYPDVIPRDRSAEVLYSAPGASEVRVDIRFADDVDNLWRRRHGQQPEPVMKGE